jgi:hypothetical protein
LHCLFWTWGLTNCLSWPQTWILLVSAYQVARITGMSHCHLVCYRPSNPTRLLCCIHPLRTTVSILSVQPLLALCPFL